MFEFAKGETFQFPDESITTPRANRAIITTAIQGPERRFHSDIGAFSQRSAPNSTWHFSPAITSAESVPTTSKL